MSLGGARSFINGSSAGAARTARVVPDDTTTICNGDNTARGYVARFCAIDPGSDGEFTLTVGDGGSANPPKFYANAVLLRAVDRGGSFAHESVWKYNDTGTDLGTAWKEPDFDATGWASGPAKLGYGRPIVDTTVSYGPVSTNKHITTYFRTAFALNEIPSAVGALTMYAIHDDGFVAYLNGQEVVRRAMPDGAVNYRTCALLHNGEVYEPIDLTAHKDKLVRGNNVLAVEVHQRSPSSSDLLWDAEIVSAPGGALPAVGFASAGSEVGEAVGLARVPVRLSRATLEPVTVRYTAGGNASAGADYSGGEGTLVFAPGETQKEIGLYIVDDGAEEMTQGDIDGRETVNLALDGPSNAVLPESAGSLWIRHELSIVDNDRPERTVVAWEPLNDDLATSVWSYTTEIWGSSPDDVFAVSGRPVAHSTIVHFDGVEWTVQAALECPNGYVHINGLWGSGPADVWAVGWRYQSGAMAGMVVYRYDGAAWRDVTPSITTDRKLTLDAVWCSSPTDVWAVGGSSILHFDGRLWTLTDVASLYEFEVLLRDIWGSGPNDVYAVGGDQAVILHFDGTRWSRVAHPGESNAFHPAVCGTSANDVYVLAGNYDAGSSDSRDVEARVLHFDGRSWTILPITALPRGAMVEDLCAGRGRTVCVVAEGRGVVRGQGGSWAFLVGDHAPSNPKVVFGLDRFLYVGGYRQGSMRTGFHGADIWRLECFMNRTGSDFDADGKADLVCFERAPGDWHILESGGAPRTVRFGWAAVTPLTGDFDGDGAADLAVYHPDTGNWYLRQSTAGYKLVQFGWREALPALADYDGDGKTDIAVYHPASGSWYLAQTRDGFRHFQFGWSDVEAVPADYDGDGRADIAVYHPASGHWYQILSSQGFRFHYWGWMQAQAVPADYDGDGKADVAVYYPGGGAWYILGSAAGYRYRQFGWSEAAPVAADYDGDGKADIAVHHSPSANWYLLQSSAGFRFEAFGPAGADAVR